MAGRVAFPQSVITRVRILVYVFAACIASADSFHHAGTAPASGVPVAARNRCPRGLDARSGSILGLYKRQIYYHTSSRSVGPFPVPGFLGSRRTRYSEAQMQPWSSPASAKIGSPAGGNVASRAKEEHIKIMLGKRVGPASCQDPKALWALLPDHITAKYRVVKELGRGTYGTVLMAERVAPDEEEAQFVAVKLCRPQPGEMPLMAKEGLAMTRLGDVPHCARLIDMGVVARKGGLCWIMMEHLVGTSLEEVVVTRGPLAVKEACLAAIDVLAALDGMHALGLLHRDVKPMNVMRVPLAPGSPRAWSYKLVDFGTATGLLGGTGAARAVGLPSLVLGLDGQGGSAAVPPEIEAVYATLDAGGDGRIREAEVGALLQSFGLALSEEELAVLTQRYDQDGDRAIDVEEFCAMYAELAALPYSAMAMDADFFASLGEIFVSIAQGSDTLSPAQLAECFASLARQPTEAQLQRLLEKYDTNADGAIDLHEFALMYGELAHLQDALTWAGTHGFLCPEAYNGGALSAASDVYSVGAMLFKIVSGRLPFTVTGATWGQGLVGDLTQKAPNLKSVVFNIPPEFAQIVAKALRKDASRRYGSAQEMRRALQQCLATL